VRWFRDFAKFERSCLLPNYRAPRAIIAVARQVFDHIAEKGYDRVITFARPEYARLWSQALGFEINRAKAPLLTPFGSDPYVELVKTISPVANVVSSASGMGTLEKIEGCWDEDGTCSAAS
jgi:hypothetical protein